ncbi:MAG: OmpA family protein [Roseibacillus sp.]
MMKSVFLLLASAHLVLGQATVVTCFDEAHEEGLPTIGIIPVEDYQKATAEVERLQRELDAVQKKQESRKRVAAVVAEQKKMVQALRNELNAAKKEDGDAGKKTDFAKREKALVEKVNRIERERNQATEQLQKRVDSLQLDFGRKQDGWERKLLSVEKERDEAISKIEAYDRKWETARQAWKLSVEKWNQDAEQAVRRAQRAEAQKAVANTARLAADWQAERKLLEAKVVESEAKRIADGKAWEESAEDWRLRAAAAVRASNVRNAQAAVANTAQLAEAWQNERNELEAQVKEMSATLAKLEGQLGVQGFEDKQAEVLRLGLMQKSQALEDLGSDASKLAMEWKNEREESRRELDAMRDLYKSTARDVKTRDQRVRQLDTALANKNKALDGLAIEAGKLSESWKEQRGGLQKKIASLEKQLGVCQGKLKEAVKKEKAAQSQIKKVAEKKNDLQVSAKLKEQLAVAADLQGKLALAKQTEDKLKTNFAQLRGEVTELKLTISEYKSQKEADAKAIAALQAELKQVKESHAATEQKLASANEVVKKTQLEAKNLQQKSQDLERQLAVAKKELATARKQAEANEKVKAEAAAKAAQVENLENQLGRLAVAQQELEGTLIATLGDFEKLQKSYIELKSKSADGGEAAKQAIAARKAAEAELLKVKEKLKGEEANLREAKAQVQQVEEKRKAAEAEAKAAAEAGKAALGKCKVELQKVLREMGELQLKQGKLVKEKAAAEKGKEAFLKCEAELEKLRGEMGALQLEREKLVKETAAAEKAAAEKGKQALAESEAELQKVRREVDGLRKGQEELVKEKEALRQRFVNIEPVRYQLASANVVAQQQRVLAEVRQVLEVYPSASFSIKGHTCNIGSEEANLKLSEDRAMVLRDFLVENGLEEERFTLVEGCGDTEPQASNETDEGRRQNRRVEIEIVQ